MMTDAQIRSHLNAAGKACFVRYLEQCEDSTLSNTEIANRISADSNYPLGSGQSRVSKIRSILQAGKRNRALEIIIESNVRERTKRQARSLLGLNNELTATEPPTRSQAPSPVPNENQLWVKAFQMPTVLKITSRTSSITNAFINAIIPIVPPTVAEIQQALQILQMQPDNVKCSYCGDTATEWDHLKPLVSNKKPTGYISEIHNLVPACGKCNQSKGNKLWNDWIISSAKKSPKSRGVANIEDKIQRLEDYEAWGKVQPLDLKGLGGDHLWEEHWRHWEMIIDNMIEAQKSAALLRTAISEQFCRSR